VQAQLLDHSACEIASHRHHSAEFFRALIEQIDVRLGVLGVNPRSVEQIRGLGQPLRKCKSSGKVFCGVMHDPERSQI